MNMNASENEYTVKRLAEICGVSETAIKNLCKKLNVAKVANQWKPNEQQAQEIIKYYLGEVPEVAQPTEPSQPEIAEVSQPSQPSQDISVLNDFIVELKQQIEIKDEQIKNIHEQLKEKDRQIANFQTQINQLIQTNSNLSLPQATKALGEAKEIVDSEITKEETDKISFGKRIKMLFTGKIN